MYRMLYAVFLAITHLAITTYAIEGSVFSLPAAFWCNKDYVLTEPESGALLTNPTSWRHDVKRCVMSLYMPGEEIVLRFENFDITDCDVHLKIYAGSDTDQPLIHDYSCGNADLGPYKFSTQSDYITFLVEKPNDRYAGFEWRIIVTAIKSTDYTLCDGFMCDNGYCIDKELQNDGLSIDHCGDGSDEKRDNERRARMNINPGMIIAPILVPTVIIVIVCLGVCCYCKQRQRQQMMNQQQGGTGPGATPMPIVMGQAPPPPPSGYYPVAQAPHPQTQYNVYHPDPSAPPPAYESLKK